MKKFITPILLILSLVLPIMAQKTKAKAKPLTKVIFAVLNDGRSLEPIAYIVKGKLAPSLTGMDDEKILAAFIKKYYKAKSTYHLIFGGIDAGTVTIKSSNAKADCATNMAEVTSVSAKAKLKGMVMALATDAISNKAAKGVRRLPTPTERAEIEALVRAEFIKQNVSANIAKNLKYHNLTALDVDSDGKAEMVGTFWVEPSATERAMLFFIADLNAKGKYSFGFSEFSSINQEDVMSKEIKDVDEGVLHELLLDVFDYDDDKVAEIFTYSQSFESAGFNAFRREKGKWVKTFEGSNYHCGY